MKGKAPKRILMTADAVGGVWNYSLELCRAFESAGIEVLLATMGPAPTPVQQREIHGLSNVQLVHGQFRLEWMDGPWEDVGKAGDWLLELETDFAPELIHLNGYAHGSLPWSAPKLVVGHSCVLSWWKSVKGVEAPDEWNTYREKVEIGLKAAELVVAPSRAMLNSLNAYYGPFAKAMVVPNGRTAVDQKKGMKENMVMAAGRVWDEAKNIAALQAVAKDLSWSVCLAGEELNPSRGPASPGERTGVQYLGWLSPVVLNDWLRRASIYALPARYEPFGLSILEAALAGCALVLGDIPSLREIWADSALFVSPNDRDGLRQAIQMLIADDALRQEFGRKARTRATCFTTERMANAYLSAYAGILHGRAGQRIEMEAACA